MLYRLRHDFQLFILTLLGACALFGISPFVVYRFASHDPVAGAIDLLIMLAISGIVIFAWKTGDTRRAGLWATIAICTGAVTVSIVIGSDAVFWLFPALVASFFLTTPAIAVGANIIATAIVAIQNSAFDSSEQMLSFVATSITVSACVYIFARRSEHQRQLLERLATHDPLTGAKNRRALEEDMQVAVADNQRNETAYVLVILDLDHFKRVNDRFGHAVGDTVLVGCAELLSRYTRVSDNLYRFGGEEFVLILPGIGPEAISDVVENIRLRISGELHARDMPVTASIGVATLRAVDSVDSWMERADNALYSAKSSGRNAMIIADYASETLAQSRENGTNEPPA